VNAGPSDVRLRATSLLAVLIGAGTVILYSSSLEHRQRYEEADIAKLAALTRVDHSTIFFHGYTKSGYVRDGQFHPLVFLDRKESRAVWCKRARHFARWLPNRVRHSDRRFRSMAANRQP
jgi:hypothetical protein